MPVQNCVAALIVFLSFIFPAPAHADRDEGTVSMSLIKVAEGEKRAEGLKVKTRVHVVKRGEHLWKILRQKGLLNRPESRELVEITKELNSGLPDLDLIRPGDKILLPVIDEGGPAATDSKTTEGQTRAAAPASAPKSAMPFEIVKVKPGESLFGIIEARYRLTAEELYNNYLPRFKELNPRIKDINRIIPGQRLRIPVPGPREQTAEAQTAPSKDPNTSYGADEKWRVMSSSLARLFSAMGEEWIDSGRHFLPLKSGGQVELEAELFPLLSLSTGMMLFLDLKGSLPARAAKLIEESWGNYRVVGLRDADPGEALRRILPLCGFENVLGKNQSFKIMDAPEIHVAGDWILVYPAESEHGRGPVVVISDKELPNGLKDYLETAGVRWLNLSRGPTTASVKGEGRIRTIDADPSELVGHILAMTGKRHEKKAALSLDRGRKGEFSINLKADYLVHTKGRKAVIDLTGLGADIEAIIKEKGLAFLSLSGEGGPQQIVKRLLSFLDIPFTEGRQEFHLLRGGDIRMASKGIAFADHLGKKVFLSEEEIPPSLAAVLEAKGIVPARLVLDR